MTNKIAEIMGKFTLMSINGRVVANEVGSPTPAEREFIGHVCVIKTELENQAAEEVKAYAQTVAEKYAKIEVEKVVELYERIWDNMVEV